MSCESSSGNSYPSSLVCPVFPQHFSSSEPPLKSTSKHLSETHNPLSLSEFWNYFLCWSHQLWFAPNPSKGYGDSWGCCNIRELVLLILGFCPEPELAYSGLPYTYSAATHPLLPYGCLQTTLFFLPPWGSFQDFQLVWLGVSFLNTSKIVLEFPLESILEYLY